ncbi:MAG: prepilin-type N-terminal cleavage/methylation domain-containing protein [Abditibacteriota bacterium]|nr:prepilin-type N-terminal cleavage/methylation domain-containing protein [Abditibacteriota bacterium]
MINKKGFTLIELLVVIAIIAILAAILFPVFAQAREKARQSNCLSNCKQIGTALQLYVDDYEETMPKMCNTYDPRPSTDYPCWHFQTQPWGLAGQAFWTTWMDSIYPYVKNVSLFCCPSGSKGYKINTSWQNIGSFTLAGYGMNNMLVGGQPYVASAGTGIALAEINNTAETVFVCETLQNPSTFSSIGMEPVLISSIFEKSGGWGIPAKHNDGMNYTFCDGHAKYFKRYDGPGLGNYQAWISSADPKKWWSPNYTGN